MLHIKSYSQLLRFSCFWLLAGLCEFPFLQTYLLNRSEFLKNHLFFALALHIMSVILLFSSVKKPGSWFASKTLWVGPVLIFSLLMPFFGWIMLGVSFFIYFYGARETDLESRDEHFLRSESLVQIGSDHGKGRIARELDFMNLVDILKSGDVQLVRSAVEKLASLQSPESIKVLQEERSNPNPEIRFYITSALTKLKKEFDEELEAAKEEMHNHVYKVSARHLLAKVYFKYAQSGLLDDDTKKVYMREALFHVDFVCKSEHVHPRFFWLKYAIEKRLGQYQEAFESLQQLKTLDPSQESLVTYKQTKLFFKMKKWSDFYERIKNLHIDKQFAERDQIVLRWWGVI